MLGRCRPIFETTRDQDQGQDQDQDQGLHCSSALSLIQCWIVPSGRRAMPCGPTDRHMRYSHCTWLWMNPALW